MICDIRMIVYQYLKSLRESAIKITEKRERVNIDTLNGEVKKSEFGDDFQK